ncbi:MAG TPA: serine--tRNA ligase [Gaiellaceae bacterium]|jgi:seryl-tRNA synthetase|nr:serine--tRNA ligase [Gaiellaceae bacterium]
MIDLREARANPEAVRAALARRGAAETFDALLAADERWRALVPQVDELRAQQKIDGKPTPEQLEELKRIKEQLRSLEEELSAAEGLREEALARVPNPPHASAADGLTEDDAVEIKRWGDPPKLEHPREHTEIGDFELERAAKVSGARFGFLTGDTALLAFALYRFALERLVSEGFRPMLPPVLVREDAMYGTGFFPSDKSDYYAVPEDGLYLVGTSEVPLIGMHLDEILDELPIRYCAFSSCFRREAGAAGRDTRGMFRVHQFQKVEMVVYTHPADSWDVHDQMLAIEESLVQAVGLPYRVVNTAAGDLSAAAAKRYDIEAWFPSQERYREITSCSNTTDFQARRSGIRYRAGDGKLETPHTLNGTAVTDRWVLSILENFQGEVPDALQQYGAPAHVRK